MCRLGDVVLEHGGDVFLVRLVRGLEEFLVGTLPLGSILGNN